MQIIYQMVATIVLLISIGTVGFLLNRYDILSKECENNIGVMTGGYLSPHCETNPRFQQPVMR